MSNIPTTNLEDELDGILVDFGRFLQRNSPERADAIKQQYQETKAELLSLISTEAKKAEKVHIENYRWLLGYGDFPVSEPGKRYNWRTELRKKIPPHIIKALQKEGEQP